MSQITGEDLYQELQAAALRAGMSLTGFAAPIFTDSWKIEQLRIAQRPKPVTIERVRALIEGRPIPGKTRPSGADRLLPGHKSMTRLQAEAMGLPRSGRSVAEEHALAIAKRRKLHEETMRELSHVARETRRPGQPLGDRLRELRRELVA